MDQTAENFTDIQADAETRTAQNGVGQAATDLAAYPILTEEIGRPSAPRPAGPGGPGGSPGTTSIGQIVEGAVRDVLGWRPDPRKPSAFVAALNQAFALKQVQGHVEWTWTPRSYAVQTDMGAVTGAQASIYARAREALESSLPLLDGLHALRADVVEDDMRTIRDVARQQMEQLVAEFGLLGGPRVQRVDEKFTQLLGRGNITNPERLPSRLNSSSDTSTLGELRDRFGLLRVYVNTVEDEQNLTNYLVVVDYLIGLRQSWNAQRQLFALTRGQTGPEPYLGTQLVLLSRDLEVVAEAVQEVSFAMDSVFLGPAERQTTVLRFADAEITLPGETSSFSLGDSDLFVASLLDWIYNVAAEEGPRAIQSSGKDGVVALVPVLDQLRHFAHAALVRPGGLQEGGTLPASYRTARVQVALQALARQLDGAFNTAGRIKQQEAIPAASPATGSGSATFRTGPGLAARPRP